MKYFNAIKSDSKQHQLHKQFLYPIFEHIKKELTTKDIINFIEKVKFCPIKNINIIGSDLLNYNEFELLISHLSSLLVQKHYYLDLSDITKDNIYKVSKICNEFSVIVLTLFYNPDITNLIDIVNSLKTANLPIHYRCTVSNETEVLHFKKIISECQITNYSFIPYYTNNYKFFKENVFLRFDEVLELQNDIIKIHSNEYINPVFFGKICLMPDNTVKTDIHSTGIIGYNDENFIIQESLYKALTSENNWRLTRNKVEPCKNCVARFLCTPISNYEIVLKKFKICEQ